MMYRFATVFAATALFAAPALTAAETADLVLRNGAIYTVTEDQPWVEAVAIKDGTYLAVGSAAEIEPMIGAATEVIDLEGRMAMPGLIDGHLHPVWGSIQELFQCDFPFSSTPQQIFDRVAECAAANPDAEWIVGGQWDSDFFKNHDIASPRAFLDEAAPGKAVYLGDDSGHNGWANTKALELVGITKDTPDPPDGRYERDPETGEPNGVLIEGAQSAFEKALPDYTTEQIEEAIRYFTAKAHRFGLVGVKNANARHPHMEAAARIDREEGLGIYMAMAIQTPYGARDGDLDFELLEQLRTAHATDHVLTDFVKIFMDGVPTSSRTAAMIAPYMMDSDFPEATTGMLHLPRDRLAADLVELDRRGFTVKIHTAGDRSVQVTLDAIAAARETNGDSGLRHEMAHAGFIHPEDLARFVELNAVADLSPVIWYRSSIIQSVLDAVGPRGFFYWPTRSLVEAGAPVLAGSDWPAAVETPLPWLGIEALVTRMDPETDDPATVLWKAEAVTLDQALYIYTMDGARAIRMADRTGSVEAGKFADLIVLNQNIFDEPVTAVSETRPVMTFFQGELVYEAAE